MTAPSAIGMTAEHLRSIIHYDPETGIFLRMPHRGRSSTPIPTGSDNKGYQRITIQYKQYPAHRLAWLYMTGREPPMIIDHINMNKSDNRWCNLREATPSQSIANQGLLCRNRSGFRGVRYNEKQRTWSAVITVMKRQIRIGTFKTAEEASQAYKAAALKQWGDFARFE